MAFLIYLFHGTEAATRIVLWKKVLLEISQNLQENTRARVSFLIKLQEACNFIKKETLARVFSCEFCKISKNTFLTEHLWTTASHGNNEMNASKLASKYRNGVICGWVYGRLSLTLSERLNKWF